MPDAAIDFTYSVSCLLGRGCKISAKNSFIIVRDITKQCYLFASTVKYDILLTVKHQTLRSLTNASSHLFVSKLHGCGKHATPISELVY